ncbi:hypothetical protein [Culicoidibacter larvae]|uniref:Asp23/Gls24 family envelope stress response protein n=1 Tax=Culicoidibacter larvae TaxID=2579976 RepID=A0A5R8QD49_9FIRM|nr:hypothetical protein [Culicoidibacter larvae]TLG74210.1 hypothetical protein FEZ08_05755 [Culicoidibacter larvae]
MKKSDYFYFENDEGIGAVNRDALIYVAYQTSLEMLDMYQLLPEEQVKKLARKKVILSEEDGKVNLHMYIPMKRNVNAREVCEFIQHEVRRVFLHMWNIKIHRIDLTIDMIEI